MQLTRCIKNMGDAVTHDEPILEISTDLVDSEIPCPIDDTLVETWCVGNAETDQRDRRCPAATWTETGRLTSAAPSE